MSGTKKLNEIEELIVGVKELTTSISELMDVTGNRFNQHEKIIKEMAETIKILYECIKKVDAEVDLKKELKKLGESFPEVLNNSEGMFG